MLLDVDESLLQRRLLIKNEPESDAVPSLLDAVTLHGHAREEGTSSKLVVPIPGKCYKYKDEETGKKYFLNLCHTDAIHAPADLSEKELADLIYSDKVDTFRLPLSSGESHEEKDKTGQLCQTFDIAVNSQLFAKIVTEPLFSMFFLHVACNVLEEKYGLIFDPNSWIPLHNRKSIGKIKKHKIQYRDENPLVNEVPQVERVQIEARSSMVQPLITEVSTTKFSGQSKFGATVSLERKHDQNFVRAVIHVGKKAEETAVGVGGNIIRVTNPYFSAPVIVDIAKAPEFGVWNQLTSDVYAVANKETQVVTVLARLERFPHPV